jgi:hypothetical protein
MIRNHAVGRIWRWFQATYSPPFPQVVKCRDEIVLGSHCLSMGLALAGSSANSTIVIKRILEQGAETPPSPNRTSSAKSRYLLRRSFMGSIRITRLLMASLDLSFEMFRFRLPRPLTYVGLQVASFLAAVFRKQSFDPGLRSLLAIGGILEAGDFSVKSFNVLLFEGCLNSSPGKLPNYAAFYKPTDGLTLDAVEIIERFYIEHCEQPATMRLESLCEKRSTVNAVLNVMRVFQGLGRVQIAGPAARLPT